MNYVSEVTLAYLGKALDTYCSGVTKTPWSYQGLEEAGRIFPLEPLGASRGHAALPHLDFGLVASRAVREQVVHSVTFIEGS
jgi:hypothetical protein